MRRCDYSQAADYSECLNSYCPYILDDSDELERLEMTGSSGEYADDVFYDGDEYNYREERRNGKLGYL